MLMFLSLLGSLWLGPEYLNTMCGPVWHFLWCAIQADHFLCITGNCLTISIPLFCVTEVCMVRTEWGFILLEMVVWGPCLVLTYSLTEMLGPSRLPNWITLHPLIFLAFLLVLSTFCCISCWSLSITGDRPAV